MKRRYASAAYISEPLEGMDGMHHRRHQNDAGGNGSSQQQGVKPLADESVSVHMDGINHGGVETAAVNKRNGGGNKEYGGRGLPQPGADLGINGDKNAGQQLAAGDIQTGQAQQQI